jgi:hypothetical protein
VTDRSAPQGGGWSPARSSDDEGWGPATPVRAGGSRAPRSVIAPPRGSRRSAPDAESEWSPAGPVARRRSRTAQTAPAAPPWAPTRAKERGLPWWAAVLVLIAIAAVGGLIDTLGSMSNRGGFNVGIVVASIVAILVVRRSQMFPVVIAPPIIYSAAAVLQLYLRSGGLSNKKVVFDAAANYLVYGFPAIASATAAVLIIAGVRLITRR